MITGNEPAMPLVVPNNYDGVYYGLTIRQHFAAMAMQGMCAVAAEDKIPSLILAEWSANFADALIAELNKEK